MQFIVNHNPFLFLLEKLGNPVKDNLKYLFIGVQIKQVTDLLLLEDFSSWTL